MIGRGYRMILTAFDILTDQTLSLRAWDEHRNWTARYEAS